jgi:hypothetical protein
MRDMHGQPLSSRVVLLTGATLHTANEYRTSAESGSTLASLAGRDRRRHCTNWRRCLTTKTGTTGASKILLA